MYGHMITRCKEQVEMDANIKVETKLVSDRLSTAITNPSNCNMTFFSANPAVSLSGNNGTQRVMTRELLHLVRPLVAG